MHRRSVSQILVGALATALALCSSSDSTAEIPSVICGEAYEYAYIESAHVDREKRIVSMCYSNAIDEPACLGYDYSRRSFSATTMNASQADHPNDYTFDVAGNFDWNPSSSGLLARRRGSGPNKLTITVQGLPGRPTFSAEVYDASASIYEWVGSLILVRNCVGAGPGCDGNFYDLSNQSNTPLDLGIDSILNFYGASVLPMTDAMGDERFIIVGGSGGSAVILDTAAQRVTHHFSLPEVSPDSGSFAFVTGSGELIFAMGAPEIGAITHLDLESGDLSELSHCD